MAQVILFGGGDGGGLLITANGVRPIPPFDPGLRLHLRGVAALVQSSVFLRQQSHARELNGLVNKLSNIAIGCVEAVVGPLDGVNGLIFQDEDGGFTCGSTGKPPIPLPWPPRVTLGLGDLVAHGVVERDVVDFISAASAAKIPARDIVARPTEIAKKLKLQLSQRAVSDLSQLAPENIGRITDPTNREVVTFFNKVLDDGRFVDRFASQPFQVAKDLGIELSEAALDRLIAGGSWVDPESVQNPIAVAVAVGIVIMLVDDEAITGLQNVRDLSGVRKL